MVVMTSSKTAPATTGRLGTRSIVLLVLLLAAVAAAVVIPLSALSRDVALELVGVPDPGVFTTAGLPALRSIGELLASVAVGAALFAAFFTPPQKDKTLDVDGYRMQQILSLIHI